MGANDDGATALLLVFCSLDALRRLRGPFGAVVAGVSCLLLVVGLVWVITWANQAAQSTEESSNASSANERRHTPSSSVDSFWVSTLFVFLLLSLLATPSCYYAPRAMRREKPIPTVECTSAPTESRFPLISLATVAPFDEKSKEACAA